MKLYRRSTLGTISSAYDLMAMTDRQTLAISSEFIPRSAGYFEGIALIESLLKRISEVAAKW